MGLYGLASMIKTRAFLLRKIDYSETSLVTVFFTEECGKVQFLIKGAKRTKGGFRSSFEHFSCYEVVYRERSDRKGLTLLREAHLVEGFPGIRRDLERFYAASYWVELLDALTELEDPHSELFTLLFGALNDLNALKGGAPLEGLSRSYEARLLRELGFLGEFTHCSSCQAECRNTFYVDTQSGRPHCDRCRTNASIKYPLEVVEGIETLKKGWGPNIASNTLKLIQKLLWFYVDLHLTKPLRSRRFVVA